MENYCNIIRDWWLWRKF